MYFSSSCTSSASSFLASSSFLCMSPVVIGTIFSDYCLSHLLFSPSLHQRHHAVCQDEAIDFNGHIREPSHPGWPLKPNRLQESKHCLLLLCLKEMPQGPGLTYNSDGWRDINKIDNPTDGYKEFNRRHFHFLNNETMVHLMIWLPCHLSKSQRVLERKGTI